MSDSQTSTTTYYQRLSAFSAELQDVFREHRRALTCLSLIAALILFSYSVARGPSESLFLKYHDRSNLPGLWIEMGIAAIFLVSVYNRLLNYISLYRLFHLSFWITALFFGLLLSGWIPMVEQNYQLWGQSFPFGPVTLLRIWCDLYIVLLVETFWSLSNLHFSLKSATLIYGFLGMAGSFGSMLGNSITAFYAVSWGTDYLIALTIPCAILMSLCLLPLKHTFTHLRIQTSLTPEAGSSTPNKERSSFIEGLRVISRSEYLPFILLLVLSSQVAVTLIDYQYKGLLQDLYPDVNDRSAIQGWVYLSIDVGSIIMQLLTGVTITLLGVGATLTAIPLLLLGLCFIPIFMPIFLMIAIGKSASKFFTYSIFKSAKELIYLPLSYDEQTQGKAIIDIMVYRQAKLLASVLLIALSAQQVSAQSAGWFAVGSIVIWISISLILWFKLKSTVST